MNAAAILRGARRGAGLSQRELALRAETTQASVSRIERGVVSPTVDTLERLLKECGEEVVSLRRPGEGVDVTLIHGRLRLTPGQRAREVVNEWRETKPFRDAARRTIKSRSIR